MRYLVVADGDANVTFSFAASVPSVTFAEDCLVFRARGPSTHAIAVAWSASAQVEGRAQVAGHNVTILPPQVPEDSPGSSYVSADASDVQSLQAGESLLVELGGSRPWYGGAEGHAAAVALEVEGEARVIELPPVPLACGFGSRQAQGSTAGAASYFSDASVGGRIPFAEGNGTTFVARAKFEDRAKVHVEIGGATHPLQQGQQMHAAPAGPAALVFEQWTGFPDQLAWLFVAEDWSAA